MAALAPVAPKLAKLLPLLSSDRDGEVVATARAIERLLRGAGLDLHTLAAAVTAEPETKVVVLYRDRPQAAEPENWATVAAWCHANAHRGLSSPPRNDRSWPTCEPPRLQRHPDREASSMAQEYLRQAAPSGGRLNRIDFGRVNSAALNVLPSLLSRWLPDGRRAGHEWVARNPRRADRSAGSFSVNMTTGKWADFASGEKGGDVVSLAAYLAGTGQADAARSLADMLGVR